MKVLRLAAVLFCVHPIAAGSAETYGAWTVRTQVDRLSDTKTTVMVTSSTAGTSEQNATLVVICTKNGVVLGLDPGRPINGASVPVGLRIDREPAKYLAWEVGESGSALYRRAEKLVTEMAGKTQLYLEVKRTGLPADTLDFSLVGLDKAITAARPGCPL